MTSETAPALIAIVGASVGGVRTAQALRSEGYDGRIVLLGAEADLPYDKPPLSKQFLAGEWGESRVSLLTQAQADEAKIELRLGALATGLDVAQRRVELADGSHVSYDSLVVATGAAARPSPWKVASGVHVVRSLRDSVALREDLRREGPVVVIGGGFIGAEVAATARAAGHAVTIVDPLPVPMARVVGAEIGQLFAGIHARNDVTSRFGAGVAGVEGSAGDLRVTLADGTVLPATTVVVGIGAIPNVGWLQASGLVLEDGVLCDRHGRALERTDVHAVGDVARWFHPGHGQHVRVEHWTNAVDQAACVAHNLVHPEALTAYSPLEYVWSDQYDWRIQIVGRPARGTSHVTIGEPDTKVPRFAVLYRGERDRLEAAVTVNWPKALMTCRRAIGAQTSFEASCASLRALPLPAPPAAS